MSDDNVLRVVSFPGGDVRDIPQQMENAAQDIRNGNTNAQSAVCVVLDESGQISVFGWGDADDIRSLGLLQLGAAWLTDQRISS